MGNSAIKQEGSDLMGMAITFIIGIGAISVFTLANYNRHLDTYDDEEEGDNVE